MNPLPRTGSYLIDSMLFAVGAICFTLAVGLVVIVGALLIQATMLVSEPYVGSRSAASLLALVVFAAYVGVPSYLIAAYADDPEDQGVPADRESPDDPREQATDEREVDEQAADEQPVTADREEELSRDGTDSEEGSGDVPRPEAARCDGARPEGEHGDRPDGEGP